METLFLDFPPSFKVFFIYECPVCKGVWFNRGELTSNHTTARGDRL
ncbi:MAG: zf-TFIIB domain-containing protein [Desulfobacterales bacterium]|nr:zf-TFIIB domain-containing protein [Desulfobacterales bacterium]